MIKIMAGVLGLTLCIAPVVSFTADANSSESPQAKPVPRGKDMPRLCSGVSDGTMFTGTVIGLGADWFADNEVSFSFRLPDGSTFTGIGLWNVANGDTRGRLLANVVTTAYLTKNDMTVYCGSGQPGSFWLGEGRP